jgi:hypothetical protein
MGGIYDLGANMMGHLKPILRLTPVNPIKPLGLKLLSSTFREKETFGNWNKVLTGRLPVKRQNAVYPVESHLASIEPAGSVCLAKWNAPAMLCGWKCLIC